MTEHLLHRPEIGPSLEQVRGERVAQGMGGDPFPDTSRPGRGSSQRGGA